MPIFILLLLFFSAAVFPQNGVVKNYYPDGKTESEINFLDGIREGEAKFYFPNGNLKEERYYVNGRVDGLVKIYADNGKLKETMNLEFGRRNGPVSLFNENGEYVKDVFYEDGRKVIFPEPVIEPPKQEVAANNENPEVKKEETKKEPVKKQTKKTRSQMEVPPVDNGDEDFLKDDPAYYLSVEVMPEPVGGYEGINRRVHYPLEAKRKKVEGIVKVLCFIDEYGTVEKAEVVEGLGFGMDDAAQITVFYTKFKPGLLRGKPVKVQMIVPVQFKL